jgi:hypothetical protein
MQLQETLKEPLQKHNRHLLVNTGPIAGTCFTNRYSEITDPDQEQELSQKIMRQLLFLTAKIE